MGNILITALKPDMIFDCYTVATKFITKLFFVLRVLANLAVKVSN